MTARTAKPKNGQAAEPTKRPPVFDRAPPFDLEAEIGVLGSMMLLADVIDEVAMIIKADDFHDAIHVQLFDVMLQMHTKGRPIDPTLMVDQCQRLLTPDGQTLYEAIGGAGYLGKILHATPHAAHAVYYAEIVREKSTLRRLITASSAILRDAYEPDADAANIVARAASDFAAVSDAAVAGDETHTSKDLMTSTLDDLEERLAGGAVKGLPTGYYRLDDMLRGGLKDSTLTIIAGRPSMGKTALALNIAANVAAEKGTVYFQSLEMSAPELGERLLCSEARVNSHRLAMGNVSPDERRKVVETAGAISQWPLFVDDSPSRTVAQIAAMARRIKRKHGLKLLVIDYLQLIEPDNQKDPREQQVAKMARRLKVLSRELQIPVICLAQLNRQAEHAKDNKPRLSHLRESGAIEQDADVILFPFRPQYYEANDSPANKTSETNEKAHLILAKQRNGPVGERDVLWAGCYARFDNLAEQRYEDPNFFPE